MLDYRNRYSTAIDLPCRNPEQDIEAGSKDSQNSHTPPSESKVIEKKKRDNWYARVHHETSDPFTLALHKVQQESSWG